MLLSIYQSTLP